jgi:hypothetical protein
MFRRNPGQTAGSTAGFLAIAWLALAFGARAQETPSLPPQELVRQAVAQEVTAANQQGAKHMFRSRKQTPRGSQTRLYVETNEAMAGLLIASNGKPLTIEQQRGEIDHLDGLVHNPEQLRRKHAREAEDTDRTLKIVKALPDAFRYVADGTEPGDTGLGKVGHLLVRLRFEPNPSYSPPSHVEQVLEGMKGYLLIDASARRIARIDGTLYREVSFGWGIVGHLDKGGHFMVQQADVGDGSWEITDMKLNITGKILLFKSISLISDEVLDDFQLEPANLPFAQGVELLKAAETNLAQGTPASLSPAKNPQ